MKHCLIVPHFNHHEQFSRFLPSLAATGLTCIIVDDGSEPHSYAQVAEVVEKFDNVFLFAHEENRGKGAAVKTALCYALQYGCTHCIQIDADGQHNAQDIQRFVDVSRALPEKMICGRPTFDESVPKVRLYGRKITDFWVVLETLSFSIKDGLCGFRVYPIKHFHRIVDRYYVGNRMDFDTEILVKAIWAGVNLKFIDTAVRYPEAGVSHFNYLRDNLVLVRLHLRLLFGALIRLPLLVYRALKRH